MVFQHIELQAPRERKRSTLTVGTRVRHSPLLRGRFPLSISASERAKKKNNTSNSSMLVNLSQTSSRDPKLQATFSAANLRRSSLTSSPSTAQLSPTS